MIVAVSAWGAAIACFGFVDTLWVGLVLLAVAGWADVISAVLRNTILQSTVPERYRSRMSSIQMAVVQGGPRLGDMESGTVATLTSIEFSVVSGGLASIAGAAITGLLLPAFRHYLQATPTTCPYDPAVSDTYAEPSWVRSSRTPSPASSWSHRTSTTRPWAPAICWPATRTRPSSRSWADDRLPTRTHPRTGTCRRLRRRGRHRGDAARGGRRPPWRCSTRDYRWLEFADHQYLALRRSAHTRSTWHRCWARPSPEIDPTAVFFPMGLGEPDHVMVHDACLLCDVEAQPDRTWFCYEDHGYKQHSWACWLGGWRRCCGPLADARHRAAPVRRGTQASGPSGATRRRSPRSSATTCRRRGWRVACPSNSGAWRLPHRVGRPWPTSSERAQHHFRTQGPGHDVGRPELLAQGIHLVRWGDHDDGLLAGHPVEVVHHALEGGSRRRGHSPPHRPRRRVRSDRSQEHAGRSGRAAGPWAPGGAVALPLEEPPCRVRFGAVGRLDQHPR